MKNSERSSWMGSCLLLGSRRQSEWCSGWSPAKPSRTHSHTLIDRLLCPHHPVTSSFMCISPYPSLSLYIYICVTLSPSEGVPVNSRVSSKIQQLLNTLKRPKRPPLPEFFVDDFEELLDGRFTTFRKRFDGSLTSSSVSLELESFTNPSCRSWTWCHAWWVLSCDGKEWVESLLILSRVGCLSSLKLWFRLSLSCSLISFSLFLCFFIPFNPPAHKHPDEIWLLHRHVLFYITVLWKIIPFFEIHFFETRIINMIYSHRDVKISLIY